MSCLGLARSCLLSLACGPSDASQLPQGRVQPVGTRQLVPVHSVPAGLLTFSGSLELLMDCGVLKVCETLSVLPLIYFQGVLSQHYQWQ